MARVLIVDDEPDLRLLVSTILRGHGHDVVETGGGQECIDLLETDAAFDVLVLDLRMPLVDGFAVLSHLNRGSLLDQMVVIAFSAHADRAIRERALAEGASWFIGKPFEPQDIVDAVARAAP